MFSGPGISAFFQPLRAAGSEAAPAHAIAATRKAGDEPKHHESFADENPAFEEADVEDTSGVDVVEDGGEFAEDHTTLSIEALRRLLAHTPAAEARTETAEEVVGDPDTRDALAAYQRAGEAKPTPAALPGMDVFVPPAKDRATAQDILMILAKLESAGVQEIAVRDGASVYDTISALCWSLSASR